MAGPLVRVPGEFAVGRILAQRGVDLAKAIETVIILICIKHGLPLGLLSFDRLW